MANLFFIFSENKDGINVDVELDIIVSGPTTSSMLAITCFLSSKFSGTHSCTNIASFTDSDKSEDPKKLSFMVSFLKQILTKFRA